jgi:23S rRNA pseudouridine1911/1915/1917 synthase
MSSIEPARLKKQDPQREWIKVPSEPIVMSTPESLRVLYEDNHIIAVNKRNSDIIQHDQDGDLTLCETVRQYIRNKYNKPGAAFIGTVHRLDRPVSGVVLYAKTTKALNRLSNMFKYREITKTYWAVTEGNPPNTKGNIINFLRKDEKLNKTFAYSTAADGRKESELAYQLIGKSDRYSLMEIFPKTGRHHQIRATLASIGCPIKGDIKYGSKRTNANASIHLHARAIEFEHPVKKVPVRITAPPPDEILWNVFLESAFSITNSGVDEAK